jgi:hypothetical protein
VIIGELFGDKTAPNQRWSQDDHHDRLSAARGGGEHHTGRAVVSDDYSQATRIAEQLGHSDTINRLIANRLAQRAIRALTDGNHSRATALLHDASHYPTTPY